LGAFPGSLIDSHSDQSVLTLGQVAYASAPGEFNTAFRMPANPRKGSRLANAGQNSPSFDN
jgi:hypothetical protein